MARTLVLYGTTDGHTAKIADAIAATLQRHGLDADVVDARRANPHPDDYAAIVIAASVRAGRYPKDCHRWVRRNAELFAEKPTAFVSVCLGILQHDEKVHQALTAIAERFFLETKWRPAAMTMVAGALLYRHYNPFVRWMMKRIARKAGGDTDTSRDYEYTDWDAVRLFAESFADLVARGSAAASASTSAAAGVKTVPATAIDAA